MGWIERLRDAAYTSPSGVRLQFDYEATSEEFSQKGGPFEFADANGTYVQPMGVTGRRYALRLILWGEDYDLQATAWMDALAEAGQGVLEHPVYGRVDVVPVGSVKRRDDLVRAANQAIIEVAFFATIGLVYPTSSVRDTQELPIAAANAAQAAQLAEVPAVVASPSFLAQYNSALGKVSGALKGVTPDFNQFNAIEKSINRGINVLVKDPLTLAFQTQQLIQQPARFLASSLARLDAYGNLAKNLMGISDVNPEPTPAATLADLAGGDMYASATVTATSLAAVTTEYENRPQAVQAAEDVLVLADLLAEYRDTSYENVGGIDTGASWQATQQVVAEAAGILIALSFKLAQERTIVVASPRSIIDIAYELYGVVDEKLDALINDNNLSGDEIIELPRGREVVYYA